MDFWNDDIAFVTLRMKHVNSKKSHNNVQKKIKNKLPSNEKIKSRIFPIQEILIFNFLKCHDSHHFSSFIIHFTLK